MEQVGSGNGEQAPSRTRRGVRSMRTAASKVPMKWITLSATALILLATAAFGGLEPAPTPDVATIVAGEAYVRPDLSMAVERAGLTDSAYAEPDDPERQLFVDIAVTNLSETFKHSSSDGALRPVTVVGLEDPGFPRMSRVGESRAAVLQPDVPTVVRIQWDVPREAYAEGDIIRIVLPDANSRQMFTQSAIVWDVTPGAYVDVVLEDLGQDQQ